MGNHSFVIRDIKIQQFHIIWQNTEGEHKVESMSLIMSWIINRLYQIKQFKEINKISSKTGHRGATDVYVKITKDKNSIITGHDKRKQLRKFLNKASVSLGWPIN